jgi:hypothetical protein
MITDPSIKCGLLPRRCRNLDAAVAADQQDLAPAREYFGVAVVDSTCCLHVHVGSMRADGRPRFCAYTSCAPSPRS